MGASAPFRERPHAALHSVSPRRPPARGQSPAASRPAAGETLFHPAVADWFAETFRLAHARSRPRPGPRSRPAARRSSPRRPDRARRSPPFSRRSTISCGRASKAGSPDATQVVYVSPLKALSNDIHRNLEAPLAGVRQRLRERGLPDVEIRTWVRTGDTPASEREKMRRRPPHILVTTPESLTSCSARNPGGRCWRPPAR